MQKLERHLSGRCVFPVYYEDTDFSGNVYHANYLKYFERAREHLIGIPNLRFLLERGYQFVVSHADIHYRYPARHGDTIVIETEILVTRSPIMPFRQRAICEADGKLLCEATIQVVALNADHKPARLDPESVAIIGATLT